MYWKLNQKKVSLPHVATTVDGEAVETSKKMVPRSRLWLELEKKHLVLGLFHGTMFGRRSIFSCQFFALFPGSSRQL